MEHYLAAQYLERIGYVSGPEQAIPEPDPESRPNINLAAIEEVQPKNLKQLKKRHAAQRPAPSPIPSRPVTRTCRPDQRKEASPPSILSENPSTTSTPSTEAGNHLKPRHKPKSPSAPPPPQPQTKAQILARLHSELERRQKTCVGIEHQLEACQQDIQTLPSKQSKIAKEHDKQITELLKPEHTKRQIKATTEPRRNTQTAEEAQFEGMRNIYLQYEREATEVPTAESVDALFAVIADTEYHVKKAEEATKAAKGREAKLEEKLYKARCTVFEMEIEIEEVENASETNLEGGSRIGGNKEGKKKRRRGKGVKSRQQGKGHGGKKV